MSQRVTVRPMSEDDISEVLRIDRELVGGRRVLTYADPVESYIGGSLAASWVAEAGGQVVGFVLCRVVEPGLGTVGGAWIELIGVSPQVQKKGVGRKLIEALLQQCQQMKVLRINIITNRHDEVFRDFFTSLGFKQGDAINYILRLEE